MYICMHLHIHNVCNMAQPKLKSMKTVNEDYSSWKPSEKLLNKCILDVYPWKERPKTIQHAKQLLIKKYKLSEAQPPE